MQTTLFSILFALSLAASLPALGQENSAPAPETQDVKGVLHWNAGLDGYASGNLNDPSSGVNAFRAFDSHANAVRLNTLGFGLDYSTQHFGAHLDAGYGDALKIMGATDRIKGLNPYLPQYFISYKPVKGSGLQIDVGKFYTSVGAEVADPNADFNYSRSLLFTLGEPIYHFGVRLNVPLTKTFSAGVQVINGWNGLGDNNDGKTLGFTTALTKARWGWSQAVLVGPEKDGTTKGQRQLANEVLTFTPRPSVQVYGEALYGRDKRVGPGTDAWYGAAIASRWSATKKLSLSPRLEYYVDQTGFTSGTAQHLHEITATAEYKISSLVTTRMEYRDDFSNQDSFERDGIGSSQFGNQQSTFALALLLSTKGER